MQPRGQGPHEGNDIVTTWRSPAVAAEDGTIKFWTTSARAGCMLYLYGASGTTYLYIHLNNDLTAKRDNRGKCVPGVAYMDGLRNGAKVKAGQQIAYNGDSGDAEGIYHLHFEVHPKDGAAVDPFPFLNAATKLLFPLPAKPVEGRHDRPARDPAVRRRGHARAVGDGRAGLARRRVDVASRPARSSCAVPPDALLDRSVAAQIVAPTRRALTSRTVVPLVVVTRPAKPTVDVTMGSPGSLSVDHIQLG